MISVVPATQPAVRPITRAGTVEQALDYSQAERTILDDVSDRDGQLDAPALYVLLRRAEMLPEWPRTMREADRPNVRNFWKDPAAYRGRLVIVEGRFVKTQDWSRSAKPTRWWGTREVWMVHLQELATGEYRPLIIMLTHRPPTGLRQGKRLRFPGLFYKLVTLPEDKRTGGDPSKTHEYPVVVAGGVESGGAAAGIPPQAYLLLGCIVVLLVVFMFLFRAASRRREGLAAGYHPRRFEDAAERASAERPGQAVKTVDEELIREVQAFKEQKKGPGKREDAGDKKDTR